MLNYKFHELNFLSWVYLINFIPNQVLLLTLSINTYILLIRDYMI